MSPTPGDGASDPSARPPDPAVIRLVEEFRQRELVPEAVDDDVERAIETHDLRRALRLILRERRRGRQADD
jgi:hypothetical protein